jgi:hypothetical protein
MTDQPTNPTTEPAAPPGPIFRDLTSVEEQRATNSFKFYFEHRSEEDGKIYSGEFTVKRMNLDDTRMAGVIYAQLCAGEVLPQVHHDLCQMLAWEAVSVVKPAPDWWKPRTFFDIWLLRHVFEYGRRWQDNFRKGAAR